MTGAAGMLGSDVVEAARAAGHDPVALSHSELDIADRPAVDSAITAARPDVAVNCAAWTDVDGAEGDPNGALAINAEGAGNVAAAAAAAGAATLHVSSDYVFDGAAKRPYVESDLTGPISYYGHSKLAGEHAVAAVDPRHVIVRSSWLFGASGSNFVRTMLELAAERGDVTVVDDQHGCPTYTGQLAAALIELAGRATAGEAQGIYHVAGAGQCSWYDFAVEIFRQADLSCEVRRGRREDLRRPAPRPAFSVLGSERDGPVLPAWQDGLSAYLAAVGGRREPSETR
ncbi:MAG TPA: dTDP-4-dehydrorhamnose reductase [Solirubrobacteraceae bacterium]|nr:dTDP-4-dehydrorhamnose reductase [Solirubrobacteraceae bacterium]